DLDDFKIVNDSLGHQAGDQVLMHVANCVDEALREGDMAARGGGDEFVLVCHVAEPGHAVGIAERILRSISTGFAYAGTPIKVTASIGVALSREGDDAESLLRRADTAVYVAKRGGKNRVELFTGDA